MSDVLHIFSKEIYRQKLQQCVADGELNEEDVAFLLRLRVMFCIPQKTVEAAHADICGSLFEKVIIVSFSSFVCYIRFLLVILLKCFLSDPSTLLVCFPWF